MTEPDGGEGRRGGGFGAWLRETVIIVVSALVLSLVIKTYLVQAFYIPSSSMEQTLLVNDRILVDHFRSDPDVAAAIGELRRISNEVGNNLR